MYHKNPVELFESCSRFTSKLTHLQLLAPCCPSSASSFMSEVNIGGDRRVRLLAPCDRRTTQWSATSMLVFPAIILLIGGNRRRVTRFTIFANLGVNNLMYDDWAHLVPREIHHTFTSSYIMRWKPGTEYIWFNIIHMARLIFYNRTPMRFSMIVSVDKGSM